MADNKKSSGDIDKDMKRTTPTLEDSKKLARESGDRKTVENIRKIQSVPRSKYEMAPMPEYKRGGKVKKTGRARLHKGETVIRKRRRSGRD